MKEIKKEIIKHYGTVRTESNNPWKIEVNLISWNGGVPNIDIRRWAPGHSKCGKGLSMTEAEAKLLKAILSANI